MYLLPARASTHRKPLLNVVHCCDALTLLRGLSAKSVKLILTSPPYDDLRTYGGNWSFPFEAIAQESYRVLADGGVLVWVVNDSSAGGGESLSSFEQALYFKSIGFLVETMIWQKQSGIGEFYGRYEPVFEFMFRLSKGEPKTFNPIMTPTSQPGHKNGGGFRNETGWVKGEATVTKEQKRLSNIWYIPVGGGMTATDDSAGKHPAMFPEELARRHIMTWTNPGDVVLDYFAGSGTTLKMARNLNRPYIGCDINADYVALAKRRLAQPYTLSMFDRVEPVAKPEQMAFSL